MRLRFESPMPELERALRELDSVMEGPSLGEVIAELDWLAEVSRLEKNEAKGVRYEVHFDHLADLLVTLGPKLRQVTIIVRKPHAEESI